ncbi:MAG TPA: insulinase family protein [Phaeodactylibacter sp.]|nr:insulinase family protein [Phaeodactylibacter sp.]
MIKFSRFVLENGLRVLVHEDNSTPMAAVNILYNVGSKDESPDKTGFAHLFEHLMFGGSKNAPQFDDPIQMAGGECNAFTNNDITNFYNIVPVENLETVLWLESDRMDSLNFSEKSLDVQRKVVVEEFKETCLNQPYGDVWHHLSDLAYKVHPYRIPTIGKIPKHVEDATLEDVKTFFYKFYRPNNAILVLVGNIKTEDAKMLIEKWFGDIPAGKIPERKLPQEPPQHIFRQLTNESNVPSDALYMAFHTSGRGDKEYYGIDLLSDILGNGRSSRLYQRLMKEERLFTQIDAYVTGYLDPGLFVIEGKPAEGVSMQEAEAAIWKELELIKKEKVEDRELQKIKNKMESALEFSEASILNKAINLAFFELLGDAELINSESADYQRVTSEEIQRLAQKIFVKENCSELHYLAKRVE